MSDDREQFQFNITHLQNVLTTKLNVRALVLAMLEEILGKAEDPRGPEHFGGSLLLVDFPHRQGADGLETRLEPVTYTALHKQ